MTAILRFLTVPRLSSRWKSDMAALRFNLFASKRCPHTKYEVCRFRPITTADITDTIAFKED
jgi:hypothetical protein